MERAASTLVPFETSICGLDELKGYSTREVSHVLSILDPDFADPPVFAEFVPHRRLTMRFHDIIEDLPDHVPPRAEDISRLIAFGHELGSAAASHLLVHCHMGVSRSTASMLILFAQANPDNLDEAMREVVRIRPRAWPNLRMVELADAELGFNGDLVSVLRVHQLRVLDAVPELADSLIQAGRGREVVGATR